MAIARALALGGFWFAFGACAQAQWTPRVEARLSNVGRSGGELVVNGVVVVRLRRALGGLSAADRAAVAAQRLRAALATNAADTVYADARTDKTHPRVKAGGMVIATAHAAEARDAGLTPQALAQRWAGALRQALDLPGLTVSASRLVVPLGGTRIVRLDGPAQGNVFVATASARTGTVSWSSDPAGKDLMLRGVSAGRETLVVTRDGATATVVVAVQPYAGYIAAIKPVTVTGTVVPAELVGRHVFARALAAARLSPGARAQITAPALPIAPVMAGQTRTYDIPLLLSGPEMISVQGVVRVSVVVQKLVPVPTATLFYSNHPERVARFGTLFVGRLATGIGSTRLLYHHQSMMDRAAWFTVELVNDGSSPTTVQVVGGPAGPVLDTVWVGYRAASLFVRDFLQEVGALVEIPARSRVALTAVRLAPGLTISGLVELRTVGGNPPLVRVAADVPGEAQSARAELVPAPLGDDAQADGLSDQVYPKPRKQIKERYAVGSRWAFVSIGRVPIKTADDALRLEGNYGVFYDIELTLENPTDRTAPAQIVFEPSAGLAGGVFLIDGKTVEIPQTDRPAETTLARYDLPPGAKQLVQIKTLPLSGSNYPATLIVRP